MQDSQHTHTLVHRGALQGSATQEHTEIVDFFRQAMSGIHLTTKGISRQTEADVRFHFLIPSLTALFRHLGVNNAGRYIVSGWQGHTCSSVIYAVDLALTSITYCACTVAALGEALWGHSTGGSIQLMPTIQSVDPF